MFVDQLENIFMSQCEVNFKGLSIALVIGVPDKEDHMLQTEVHVGLLRKQSANMRGGGMFC